MSGLSEDTRPAPGRLEVEDLLIESFDRRGKALTIVNRVSFQLMQGSILGLLGESGSGKTMICRAITGALLPGIRVTGGRIHLDGGRAGIVFADPHASLDPLQKVGAQIAEVAHVCRGLPADSARQEALRLMHAMKLPDPERVYGQYPFQVSGGMAQRVMIAAALAAKPMFIVADEPTSALDATVQIEVLDLLKALSTHEGVGILLTTHDIAVASRICTSIAVIYAGKICEIGPVEQVLKSPRHPYSRLLLAARPRGKRGQRATTIPGEPLGPGDPRPPCPFAPRCPRAESDCIESEPMLLRTAGSMFACFHPHLD